MVLFVCVTVTLRSLIFDPWTFLSIGILHKAQKLAPHINDK